VEAGGPFLPCSARRAARRQFPSPAAAPAATPAPAPPAPRPPGRATVVLETTTPSTPVAATTAAMSALSASVRSGAILTSSGGGPPGPQSSPSRASRTNVSSRCSCWRPCRERRPGGCGVKGEGVGRTAAPHGQRPRPRGAAAGGATRSAGCQPQSAPIPSPAGRGAPPPPPTRRVWRGHVDHDKVGVAGELDDAQRVVIPRVRALLVLAQVDGQQAFGGGRGRSGLMQTRWPGRLGRGRRAGHWGMGVSTTAPGAAWWWRRERGAPPPHSIKSPPRAPSPTCLARRVGRDAPPEAL
jgi:hypothetical protein